MNIENWKKYRFDRFKICPNDACRRAMAEHHNFCGTCGESLHNVKPIHARELYESGVRKGEVNKILGALNPDEFMDAVERLCTDRPLTEKQEPHRKNLQAHIALYVVFHPDNHDELPPEIHPW